MRRPEFLRLVADGNTVVEGQAKRLVSFGSALATVEKILLNVVTNGEQVAAGSIRGRVYAVRTSNTPGQSS